MEKLAIVEALKRLDPEKEEHWTSTGQPAMKPVQEMLGELVIRKEVEEAAPDCTRENARKAKESQLEGQQNEQSHENSQAQGNQSQVPEGEKRSDVPEVESKTEQEVARQEVREAEAYLIECEQNVIKAKERLGIASKKAQTFQRQASLHDCNKQMSKTMANRPPQPRFSGRPVWPPLPGALPTKPDKGKK